MACVTGGLEARVDEFIHQRLERHSVLQADGNGKREAVHEAGKCGTFLGHLDEDFARLAGLIHADSDVALVAADGKLVSDRGALARQLTAMRADEELALFGYWRRGFGRLRRNLPLLRGV